MAIQDVVSKGLYKRYRLYNFLKDWFVAFCYGMFGSLVLQIIIWGIFLFTAWPLNPAEYVDRNAFWIFRLCSSLVFVGSFLVSLYVFRESYRETLDKLDRN